MRSDFIYVKRFYNFRGKKVRLMIAPVTYVTVDGEHELTTDTLYEADPESFSYRDCYIGENISDFVYFDIEEYLLKPEERGANDNFAFDGGKDARPYLFYTFIYDLIDDDGYVIPDKIKRFTDLQQKYKLLLEDVLKNGKEKYMTSNKAEKLYYEDVIYCRMDDWYEYEDLETALDFEFKCMVNTGITVFKCQECGRVSMGRENAQCCSREVRYKVWEEEDDEFGWYYKGYTLSCKNAFKDKRYRNKQKGEMEEIYNKSKESIRKYIKRNNIKKRNDYDEILKRLYDLGEEYQENYDDEEDVEIKNAIKEEYKCMFKILKMQPKEDGTYISWEEWQKISYQYME